jgi:hypothetical protein
VSLLLALVAAPPEPPEGGGTPYFGRKPRILPHPDRPLEPEWSDDDFDALILALLLAV